MENEMASTQMLQSLVSEDCKHVTRKHCVLHGKCSHTVDKCKDLKAIINNHNKYERNFTSYVWDKKELNALIEKKLEICQEQEKEEGRKRSSNIMQESLAWQKV